MGKRIFSSRQQCPAVAVVEKTSQQAFKRVNSKENVLDVDDANSSTTTSTTTKNPKDVAANLKASQETPRKISTSTDLEEVLKESTVQERALKALTMAHCAESLACLIELFKWEKEDDVSKREELQEKIVSEYMKKGTDKEIFLPETIREKVLAGKTTLKDVKTHVINDLRFNNTLLKAIGAA